jgi:hypothetical protein
LKDAELDPVIPIRRFASDDDAETMRGLTLSYSKRPLVAAECFWHFAAFQTQVPNGRYWLPPQPIDATQALNLSAGVSNCKVSRGRSLS